MERLLFESAVRAALIAGATAAVLWAFRIKNDAARHTAWAAVVLLMLLLPIWTAAGPKLSFEVLRPAPAQPETAALPLLNNVPGVGAIRNAAAEPAAGLPDTPGTSEPDRGLNWRSFLIAIYLLGAGALLARLALGTVRAHKLIRRAVMRDGRLTSASCASPITVGWLHPVVILPQNWQQWPKPQLDAVLRHEAEHARRYDPLVQWLALFNRAVFWFHPLAWWLERRLAALAEAVCDSAVLASGHSPQDYSEYLLDLARSTMREGRRVSIVGMAMPGRYLARRIQQIFQGVPMQSISRTRIACTLVLCTLSSVVFAAATLAPQQVNRLDSKVTAIASTTFTEAATQEAKPTSTAPAQQTRKERSTPLSPPVLAAFKPPTPAQPIMAAVPQNQAEENKWFSGATWKVRGLKAARIQDYFGLSWPNPAQLERLGLTEEQKARFEKTLDVHRQRIATNQEQLEKEEAQFARALEADPIDRGAVLAQLDRVIQARGEMERADAALRLETREFLTYTQWMQLQNPPPLYFRWNAPTEKYIDALRGGAGARGGGQRGAPGQQ